MDMAPDGIEGRVAPQDPSVSVHTARLVDNRAARYAWGAGGTLSLGAGLVGVVLPGWPTTIFLIIAAACYARSSQRMYDRILANRMFGPHVRRFRETGGMPLRAKVIALSVMWPFVAFSAFVAIPATLWWASVATIALALFGTWYILHLPTDRGD